MLEKLTVAIKTIHRPWACHRLIQSLDRYAPGVKIHVLDDGHPKHRFSLHHPETAARVDQLTETEFDIGGSEGRNRLVDSVQTPYVLILDDDHVVIPQTDLAGLVAELDKHQDRCHGHRIKIDKKYSQQGCLRQWALRTIFRRRIVFTAHTWSGRCLRIKCYRSRNASRLSKIRGLADGAITQWIQFCFSLLPL